MEEALIIDERFTKAESRKLCAVREKVVRFVLWWLEHNIRNQVVRAVQKICELRIWLNVPSSLLVRSESGVVISFSTYSCMRFTHM